MLNSHAATEAPRTPVLLLTPLHGVAIRGLARTNQQLSSKAPDLSLPLPPCTRWGRRRGHSPKRHSAHIVLFSARVTYAWVALVSGNPSARITTVGPEVILSVKESHQCNSPGRKSRSGNDPRALGAYQVRGRAARAWKHSKLAACPPPLSWWAHRCGRWLVLRALPLAPVRTPNPAAPRGDCHPA
jgi:hypothetical protein